MVCVAEEKRDGSEAVMLRREKKHISDRMLFMLKQRDNREGKEKRKEELGRS